MAERFAAHGFSKVYNVEGGMDAWAREVDSGVPRYRGGAADQACAAGNSQA
jgi:hypothetical protein